MKIAVTGATGNMGAAAVEKIAELDAETLRVLVLPDDKRAKKLKRKYRRLIKRGVMEILFGDIADPDTCRKLVDGTDYVINYAAVIPPLADKYPQKAVRCNELGADALVSAIESQEKQPRLIHISTVALYGNRNSAHPFARVGDPLLVSPFDVYAATKLRGEFRVLESNVTHRAVLRQSAMLHMNMLADNMSDGLMFHTPFSAPLEWVTADDCAVLVRNIIARDVERDLGDAFWKKVFNIGAPKENRVVGFESYDAGFKIIGGGIKDYFSPKDNATRNFHGVWFADGHVLNDMFDYQRTSFDMFWQGLAKKHKIYKLGKLVPKCLIRKFVFDRLKKTYNAPEFWAKSGQTEKLTAYFGGADKYAELPNEWTCDLAAPTADDKDPNNARYTVKNYFDVEKPDGEITLDDLKSFAAAHGGKLLSTDFSTGDVYKKLDWETQDGEKFTATAYTVLRAGHWYNPIYTRFEWDFDRLAKRDAIFAQYWYDSHAADEDILYSSTEDFAFSAVKR